MNTFYIKDEPLFDTTETYQVAYSTIDDGYIGPPERAQQFEDWGIAPQKAKPENEVCSIGWSEAEQKWYGWSHRAMYGFGIGSEVKFGDCGYVATDVDDFLRCAVEFWSDDGKLGVKAKMIAFNGERVARVTWVYSDDPEKIQNAAIRCTEGCGIMYPPDTWGKGEWTANTLEDAKQMAIEFAQGVSYSIYIRKRET